MIFDAIVIFALLFSCVIAFLRGFIREVLTIIGLFVGVAAAYVFGPGMVPLVTRWLGERADHAHKFLGVLHGDQLALVCAYAVVFFPTLIVISVASYFLSAGIRAMGLGALDRTAGVIFGLMRALVILGLLWLPVYTYWKPEERDKMSFVQGSHTRVYVETVSGWLVSVIPPDLIAGIKSDAERAKEDAKTARERLQDIDLLRKEKGAAVQNNSNGNNNNTDVQPVPQPTPAAQPSSGAGYQDQQRQDMGKLINKGINQ